MQELTAMKRPEIRFVKENINDSYFLVFLTLSVAVSLAVSRNKSFQTNKKIQITLQHFLLMSSPLAYRTMHTGHIHC